MVTVLQQDLPTEQGTELSEWLRYNYYESADPLLLFLFRAKSLKETESIRLTLLLTALQTRELTAKDLQDVCSEQMPTHYPMPDEKTIRGDLKYLEEVGVILRVNEGRPYRYKAANDLIDQLSGDQLLDLYDYVDVIANTQTPSVQGYLLRDTLKRFCGSGVITSKLRKPIDTNIIIIHVFLMRHTYIRYLQRFSNEKNQVSISIP